jgi:antibiotic biosynthesis monooxygenase (ABM) superfamily enzyme
MGTLLASAVERGLHLADPRLTLEVARHWAHSPDRDSDVEQLVTTALATATFNPGYLDLEVWFHAGLRPPESTHTYRYQLHRLPGAS